MALASKNLRDYYDALHAMGQYEQAALAEAHTEKVWPLAARFQHSVEDADEWEISVDSSFTDDNRTSLIKDAPVPIVKTDHFASHLDDQGDGVQWEVDDEPALAFRYVDREVFFARGTGKDLPRRSLDLLLVNSDGTPIIGELKIGDDKPVYFALVQSLLYAAEAVNRAQRARLREHYGDGGIADRESRDRVDIYIIGFNSPEVGPYREKAYEATKKICPALLLDERVSPHIRRIAYLEASLTDGALRFQKRFAFGHGA